MTKGLPPDTLARLIALTDYFRLPAVTDAEADHYKEWHHFCILSPDVQVILNLSLVSDTRPAAPYGARVARVILLVRDCVWEGDVDIIPPRDVLVSGGRIDLHFGHNSVCFEDGMFDLSVALQNRPITMMLQLRPITVPLLLRNNTPLGAGKINWLVVPRLIASGTVAIGRRAYTLCGAPAYHDHNWGHWLWGQDFAWQWGFMLSDQADTSWSIVFDCVTDRACNHAFELSLWLWKGATLRRFFSQEEIQVRPAGYLTPRRIPKVPRAMALLAPECTTDVPRHLHITAAAGDDYLDCHFEAEDVAQIIIPNETDLNVTIINEVCGQLKLTGEVKNESVTMTGRAIFEFIT